MTEALLSFDEIRFGARKLAEDRRQAITDYEGHAIDAAAKERDYRKELAISFAKHRSEEKGVGESEILGNKDAADKRHARDVAQAVAKADLLRIDALEREQATLRQLADFSKELETVG